MHKNFRFFWGLETFPAGHGRLSGMIPSCECAGPAPEKRGYPSERVCFIGCNSLISYKVKKHLDGFVQMLFAAYMGVFLLPILLQMRLCQTRAPSVSHEVRNTSGRKHFSNTL